MLTDFLALIIDVTNIPQLYASFFFSLYRDGEKCCNHPTPRPNPNKPGRVGWGETEGLYLLHKLEKHTEKNHKHTTSQNTRRSLVPVSSEFIANIGLSGFRIQILQRSSGFTIHCINLSPPSLWSSFLWSLRIIFQFIQYASKQTVHIHLAKR